MAKGEVNGRKVIEPEVNQDRNIVNHEELSIFVDLVAKVPGRSSIVNNPQLIFKGDDLVGYTEQSRKDIHFTFPTDANGKSQPLSTSWTNIGGLGQEQTTEGFGITNIDIKLDSSFVPRVSIDFVDIRGKALFEGGRSSPYYGAFFHLPYPLFLLQFKGYYGDAITYPLHLLKFNSRFNGETGNFEIKCDFIGHTFAFLSDMLLGYAIAAPYMKEGGGEDINCGCKKAEPETIKEYIQKVKRVTNDVSNLAASQPFKNKTKLEEFSEEIETIRQNIAQKKKLSNESAKGKESQFMNSCWMKRPDEDLDTGIPFNEIVEGIIQRYSNETAFTPIMQYLKNMKVTKAGTTDWLMKIPAVTTSTSGKILINIANGKKIYDDTVFNEALAGLEAIWKAQKVVYTNQITAEAENIRLENNFDASIKYAVNVLCCGFEIFLKRLMATSKKAESENQARYKILNPTDDQLDSKNKVIYPWPLYYEVKTKAQGGVGKILTYPGQNDELKDMPEVRFVEDFMNALFETRGDLNTEDELIGAGDGWMPCNIVESPLWDDTISNPYNGLKEEAVMSLLLSRVMVNISYSYALGFTVTNNSEKAWFSGQDLSFVPDVTGSAIADNSDFMDWEDGGWKSMTTDKGFVELMAAAEASNFSVAGVNSSIIDFMITKSGEGLLEYLTTKVDSLGKQGGKKIKVFKREKGFKFTSVSDPDNTLGKNFDDSVLYYCATEDESSDNTWNYTKYTNSVTNPITLPINDELFVSAQPGTQIDGEEIFCNFKIIPQSQYDGTTKPAMNELLKEELTGAYGGNMFGGGFCQVEFSEYNLLLYTNKDNHWEDLAGGSDRCAYLNHFQKEVNREIQGFGTGWFTEFKEIYETDYINICLESSDYSDNTWSANEPNAYFASVNKEQDIFYGDFPFYVGDCYVGQIQDTYLYKLNKGLSGTQISPHDGNSYDLSKTNTAFLWLMSLEMAVHQAPGFKTNTANVDKISDSFLFAFANSNGIIEVPQIWIVYMGAILWRASQTTDPIQWGNLSTMPQNGVDGNGKILWGNVTATNRENLGAHADFLRNSSYYGSGNIQPYSAYVSRYAYTPPTLQELPIIWSKMGTTYGATFAMKPKTLNSVNIGDHALPVTYYSLEDSTDYATFMGAPKHIKDIFINAFLEWATTTNTYTKVVENASWQVVQNEIENNPVRTHYSWMETDANKYGLPRKARMYQEKELVKNGVGDLSISIEAVPLVYGTNVNSKATKYPNVDNLNSDKALFWSGVYKFATDGSSKPDTQWITSGNITQVGYINTIDRPLAGLKVTTNNEPPSMYFPKIRFISQSIIDLLDVMNSKIYILNGTWRSFIPRNPQYEISKSPGSTTPPIPSTDVAAERANTFYAAEQTLITYFDAFIAKLKEIKDEDKTNSAGARPESKLKDPDLKLAIYLQFKNIYDKWIASKVLQTANSEEICISPFFKYVDRAMNDIGDVAIINPKSLKNLFENSKNSFYNILYELLSQNNFDFFPLPHFNGFGSQGHEKIKDMFKTKTVVGKTSYSPSFVCVYVGERANTVDLENSEFGNNVIDFDSPSGTPPDFSDPKSNYGANAFKVTFGLENQNIFKSISLDQSDYKETAESLQVIDDLTKDSESVNNISFKGNDLYQVYSKRSYNCQVEMMGCATVEPLTYFQLSNVPMFKGAYMIHELSHNITPNHMTTNFTGVRIPFTNVPYVTDFAVSMGLVASIDSETGSGAQGAGSGGSYITVPGGSPGPDRTDGMRIKLNDFV